MSSVARLVWLVAAFLTACALALGLILLALSVSLGREAFWWATAALSFSTVASLLLWLWWRRLFPDRWSR